MRTAVLLIVATGLGMAPCLAQDCSNPQTQTDLTICAVERFERADTKLNADYRKIMSRLHSDSDTAKLFQAAQRAWIAFRDAECAFATSATVGGSINPMMVAECRERLTSVRVADFETYLNCEEGDVTCPAIPQ